MRDVPRSVVPTIVASIVAILLGTSVVWYTSSPHSPANVTKSPAYQSLEVYEFTTMDEYSTWPGHESQGLLMTDVIMLNTTDTRAQIDFIDRHGATITDASGVCTSREEMLKYLERAKRTCVWQQRKAVIVISQFAVKT